MSRTRTHRVVPRLQSPPGSLERVEDPGVAEEALELAVPEVHGGLWSDPASAPIARRRL